MIAQACGGTIRLCRYSSKIYAPCCGSGGMFVQSLKFIENHEGSKKDISIYGQEYSSTTYKLAKMNLAVRGLSANLGEAAADTFFKDQHPDLKADTIMANPPFNLKDWPKTIIPPSTETRFTKRSSNRRGTLRNTRPPSPLPGFEIRLHLAKNETISINHRDEVQLILPTEYEEHAKNREVLSVLEIWADLPPRHPFDLLQITEGLRKELGTYFEKFSPSDVLDRLWYDYEKSMQGCIIEPKIGYFAEVRGEFCDFKVVRHNCGIVTMMH